MLYRDISWHDVIINLCWLILMVSIGWFNRLAVLEDLGLGRSRIPQIHVALPLEGQRRHGRRRSPLALLVTHLTIFLFFWLFFWHFVADFTSNSLLCYRSIHLIHFCIVRWLCVSLFIAAGLMKEGDTRHLPHFYIFQSSIMQRLIA